MTWLLLSMADRTVESGGGPWWEFVVPAVALVALLVVVAAGRSLAGLWRELDRARQQEADREVALGAAFDGMGRAVAAARDEDGSAPASGGAGLPGMLFVVFLTLKLVGVIDWSWWWVTAPLWISAGLFVVIFVVVGLVAAVVSAVRR